MGIGVGGRRGGETEEGRVKKEWWGGVGGVDGVRIEGVEVDDGRGNDGGEWGKVRGGMVGGDRMEIEMGGVGRVRKGIEGG